MLKDLGVAITLHRTTKTSCGVLQTGTLKSFQRLTFLVTVTRPSKQWNSEESGFWRKVRESDAYFSIEMVVLLDSSGWDPSTGRTVYEVTVV